MNLSELETPCLVLDRGKVEKNILSLQRRLAHFKVKLRPHGKTAKSMDVLRMALADPCGGITVSTLKEAEYYFSHGIRDLVYAVGIAPVKLNHVCGLIQRGAGLAILLDSIEQVQAAAQKAHEHDITIPVLIELDCDGHRSGLTPADPLLVDIGRLVARSSGLTLQGVLTHAGGSYACDSAAAIRAMAARERDTAVACAKILRKNDLDCPTVSVGSTPTAHFAEDFSGVTEVRAGVFMFYDLVMAGLGVCDVNEIAVSVLASVIGHQKSKGWVIIDAGWMALSRDRGTALQKTDQGFGLACSIENAPWGDLIVSATNQEHGIITARGGRPVDCERFPIGRMVRILPNHACATAAMFDRYYVVNATTQIVAVWDRINGW